MYIESKILAVADVIDAIVSDRPYRQGLELHNAVQEIVQNRDILYDSDVVDACLLVILEDSTRSYKRRLSSNPEVSL
jgi:HD-GYP domain-containing protein (c-di-GMP phosphodiesterase class II)